MTLLNVFLWIVGWGVTIWFFGWMGVGCQSFPEHFIESADSGVSECLTCYEGCGHDSDVEAYHCVWKCNETVCQKGD